MADMLNPQFQAMLRCGYTPQEALAFSKATTRPGQKTMANKTEGTTGGAPMHLLDGKDTVEDCLTKYVLADEKRDFQDAHELETQALKLFVFHVHHKVDPSRDAFLASMIAEHLERKAYKDRRSA